MANDSWKSLKYVNVLPTGLIKTLDKAVSKLSGYIQTLTKLIKILQLFISAFSSFSVLLQTFVTYGKKVINQFATDIAGAGIYLNILVPPAFLKSLMDNKNYSDLSSGGFEGFISRLQVSLNNTSDINVPRFSANGLVGGLVIMLDANTLDDFFKGLDFFTGTFDFMDLFPINTKPMPPINLRGSSGFFVQPSGDPKKGTKIEWDAPNVRGFTEYRISRSIKSGGVPKDVSKVPSKLIGPKGHAEEGIIAASLIHLSTGKWPSTTIMAYEDKGFPITVQPNPITGGGTFIDYDIDEKNNAQYYYVIESGFAKQEGSVEGLWGPRSAECMVPTFPKHCITTNQSAVVIHSKGALELITQGFQGLGQWSSIQARGILPFLPAVLDLLNTFINKLEGSLKTNSKSWKNKTPSSR